MAVKKLVMIAGLALLIGEGRVHAQMAVSAVAVTAAPAEVTASYALLRPALQPTLAAWVATQARAQAALDEPDLVGLDRAIRARVQITPSLNGMDVDAVVELVLMEATEDQDQDLRALASQMQAQMTTQQQLGNLYSQAQDAAAQLTGRGPVAVCQSTFCQTLAKQLGGVTAVAASGGERLAFTVPQPVTATTLGSLQSQLTTAIASTTALSQQTQNASQATMARKQQFYGTLSAITKRISAAGAGIVSNLK